MLGEETSATAGALATVETPGLGIGPGIVVSTTGITLPPDMLYEDWEALAEPLNVARRGINWALGDWLNYGENRYPERYANAIEITDLDDTSLMNIAWVARQVRPDVRMAEVSWSHHRCVAPIDDDDEKRQWLQMAYDNGWSTRKLQEEIDRARTAALEPADGPVGGGEGGETTFAEEVEPIDPVLLEAEALIGMVLTACDVEARFHGSYQASRGVWPQFWAQFDRMVAVWRDNRDADDWGLEEEA